MSDFFRAYLYHQRAQLLFETQMKFDRMTLYWEFVIM